MHCTSASLLRPALLQPSIRTSLVPPAFLLPAFAPPRSAAAAGAAAPFSATPCPQARKDGNRSRGVSALRRTGLGKHQRLSVRLEHLPRPVLDPARRSAISVDADHGLWEFFARDRSLIPTPAAAAAHGRAWTAAELRGKDWEDLHRLWWTCVKERNRIATAELERKRLAGKDGMYGEFEAGERYRVVQRTMKAVRHVLTERWYAWENARTAAMADGEVDLYADVGKGERAYVPTGQEVGGV